MKNNNLEGRAWYRALKVVAIVIVILSFFAPIIVGRSVWNDSRCSYSGEIVGIPNNVFDPSKVCQLLKTTNDKWVIDGLINVLIYTIIILIGRMALKYIVFGKKNNAFKKTLEEAQYGDS